MTRWGKGKNGATLEVVALIGARVQVVTDLGPEIVFQGVVKDVKQSYGRHRYLVDFGYGPSGNFQPPVWIRSERLIPWPSGDVFAGEIIQLPVKRNGSGRH